MKSSVWDILAAQLLLQEKESATKPQAEGHLFLFNHFIDMRTTVSLSILCRKNVFFQIFQQKHVFST